MSEFENLDGELTLFLEEASVGSIANNLDTTVEGYALDARQGYALDQKKLDKTSVANNLSTSVEGYALDARRGKWLDENKIGFGDVANDLTTSDANKVLSAAQGVALKTLADSKLASSSVVNNLTTNDLAKPLSAAQGVALKALADGKAKATVKTFSLTAANWSNEQQTVNVSGVTASNIVIVTAAPGSHITYRDNGVYCSAQGSGTLTFTCSSVPTAALSVQALILD